MYPGHGAFGRGKRMVMGIVGRKRVTNVTNTSPAE